MYKMSSFYERRPGVYALHFSMRMGQDTSRAVVGTLLSLGFTDVTLHYRTVPEKTFITATKDGLPHRFNSGEVLFIEGGDDTKRVRVMPHEEFTRKYEAVQS